jgi:cell division septum initiation protein DivIVA
LKNHKNQVILNRESEGPMETNVTQFKEIADFLDGLRFKKSIFGANTADVFACMTDLSSMYKDAMTDRERAHVAVEDELRSRITEKDTRIERLISELEMAQRVSRSNEDTINELQKQLKNLMVNEQGGHEKYDVIAEALTEMKKNKELAYAQAEREARSMIALAERDSRGVIEKAEREARSIVDKAKSEADNVLVHARQQIYLEQQQGHEYLMELEQVKSRSRQSLDIMYEDFQTMTEEVNRLRDKAADLSFMPSKGAEQREIGNKLKFEGYAAV